MKTKTFGDMPIFIACFLHLFGFVLYIHGGTVKGGWENARND